MTAWIRLISYPESDGYLRQLYDRVKGPQGQIDNVMKVHSLRPHTMEGHLALYKSVMHHHGNALPVWFLECMAVYTG
ncbi:MAG: alkylhydroperoxidase, partial [Alphaproteobacteria bacterium]